ncbi:MAG: TatD family hydrolase [Oscillospiraceae bacterium]|nr:TatD family hydrolase [Oscillospiraceae bacterium]
MSNIFDSHAHYTSPRFDADRAAVLAALPQQGVVGVLCCGTDMQDSKHAIKLAEQYDYIFAAAGTHPHEAKHGIDGLRELLQHPKCVAAGEMGLDYHYDFSPRDVQQAVFTAQLELARELDKPVVIHCREAFADSLRILRDFAPLRGVMHCFTGSVEFMREVLPLGLHIGLGGAVTFKNARKPLEVAAAVPLERLLLETDAPYMAPVPHRGKRCDSTHIAAIAEKIAAVRGMAAQDLLDACADNARGLFLCTP